MVIEEDYCSFEQAKILKILGFNAVCNSHYMITPFEDIGKGEGPRRDWNNGSQPSTPCCFYLSKPTLSLVQKWLIEMHNIHIQVSIDYTGKYYCLFFDTKSPMGTMMNDSDMYEKPEQALSVAIDRCIEELKRRNKIV